jgi:hypothetical protein
MFDDVKKSKACLAFVANSFMTNMMNDAFPYSQNAANGTSVAEILIQKDHDLQTMNRCSSAI